jgi:hypothetical protein
MDKHLLKIQIDDIERLEKQLIVDGENSTRAHHLAQSWRKYYKKWYGGSPDDLKVEKQQDEDGAEATPERTKSKSSYIKRESSSKLQPELDLEGRLNNLFKGEI